MKKLYLIFFLLIVIVLVGFFIARDRIFPQPIDQEEGWTLFTSHELSLKISYPESWNRIYSVGEYGVNFELTSKEKSSGVDPITVSTFDSPLLQVLIFQHDNVNSLSFHDWINQSSAVEDEQERIRKDKQGWLGYQQWIWHQRNAYAHSTITYYVEKDDQIFEFRADIMNNNPQSEEFQESVNIINKIFNSLEFTP